MKKILLSSILAFCGTVAFSQMKIVPHEANYEKAKPHQEITGKYSSTKRGSSSPASSSNVSAIGDTILHETFGNGLAGDGSNGVWTNTGVPSTAKWEYRGTSTTPSNTTGSRGAYNNGRPPIKSVTASNGFFIFDSDYLDNGGVPGSFGTGSSPSPHTGYLTSPTINLSSYPNVIIQLTSYYRRFQSDMYIEFSTDGGATWGNPIHVYGEFNVATNAQTDSSHVTTHYVPTAVGGNANVKFRLKFDGTDNSNPNGSGYYFWMVDDIYVIEAPENDLATQTIYFNGVADSTSGRYHYARIPKRQAEFDTVRLGASVQNLGTKVQPNVKVGVKIDAPAGSTISSTSSIASLAPNALDSIDAGMYIPKVGEGLYTYNFYPISDSNEDNTPNDTTKFNFRVTSNTYAWATSSSIGYRTTTATSSYEICSNFRIYQNDTARSATVEFNHNSNDVNAASNLKVGTDILSFRIINNNDISSGGAHNGNVFAEYKSPTGTKFYVIQQGDTGNPIKVPLTHLTASPTLTPGSYWLCMKTFNHNAFVASNQARSDNNWRQGTTIVDIDGANSFSGFRVTPTLQLETSDGIDPCANVTINVSITGKDTVALGSMSATATGGTPPYSYEWTAPDGSKLTGKDVSNLTKNGTYKLVVTDSKGCKSQETTFVMKALSVGDVQFSKQLSIYPNPSKGQFTIETIGVNENLTVNIRNIIGQTIQTEKISSSGNTKKLINLNTASSGVYFVEISSEKGQKAIYKLSVE